MSTDSLVRLHIPLQGNFPTDQEFAKWSRLEAMLGNELELRGLGEVDGNEIGEGEYTIWMYGPEPGPIELVATEYARTQGVPAGARLSVRRVDDAGGAAREFVLPVAQ